MAKKTQPRNRAAQDATLINLRALKKQLRDETTARKRQTTVLGRELVKLARRVEYLGATIIEIGELAHGHGKAE
jgi:hypothetical protein